MNFMTNLCLSSGNFFVFLKGWQLHDQQATANPKLIKKIQQTLDRLVNLA